MPTNLSDLLGYQYQGNQGIQGLQGLSGLFAGQGAQGVQGLQGVQGSAGSDYWTKGTTGLTTTSNVGVGTTNPTSTLTVYGTGYFTGIVTASSFYGDGSKLTGVISGIGINTSGGNVGYGATVIDFRGAGISTITIASGIATVNIKDSPTIYKSLTAPASANDGDIWIDLTDGAKYIYYIDSDNSSSQWVEFGPRLDGLQGTGGAQGISGDFAGQGVQGLQGPTGPTGYQFGNLDGGYPNTTYGGLFTVDGGGI